MQLTQCLHHQNCQCTFLWDNLVSRKERGKFGTTWMSLLRSKHQKETVLPCEMLTFSCCIDPVCEWSHSNPFKLKLWLEATCSHLEIVYFLGTFLFGCLWGKLMSQVTVLRQVVASPASSLAGELQTGHPEQAESQRWAQLAKDLFKETCLASVLSSICTLLIAVHH